jgi:hypothetical protein
MGALAALRSDLFELERLQVRVDGCCKWEMEIRTR